MKDDNLADVQDTSLEKKVTTTTNQPPDKIKSDGDLEDQTDNLMGLLSELDDVSGEKDWQAALEKADEAQELMNEIHAYIAEQADE